MRSTARDPFGDDRSWTQRSIPLSELVEVRRQRGARKATIIHHMGKRAEEHAPTPVLAKPVDLANLARLDSVIHDFLGCLDQACAEAPVTDAESTYADRFRRILDYRPHPGGPVLGPPVLCGVSPPIGLEGLFGFLGSARKTGTLRAQAGEATYMISVVLGDVVHALSHPRPEQELIGNLLLANGTIAADELELFFEVHGASASRLGEAINREELVGIGELKEALELQLHHLFDRLLAERTAEWCFHEGEATLAYIDCRMNATSVILQSARKRDELGTT